MKVFVSAGEASGDLHGAALVQEMKALHGDMHVTALGGFRLRDAGARILVDSRELSLIGVLEVFPRARKIFRAWRRIKAHFVQDRPDLVVLVDFPDFNFLLGRLAHRLGIKVFYYISPQVWAWRTGRVRSLKRFVDAMAVILPFEKDFYRKYGMDVHYVGHPLVDVLRNVPPKEVCRQDLGLPPVPPSASDPEVVALLPGSRSGEVRSFLPLLLESARKVHSAHPHIQFLVPVAPELDLSFVRSLVPCPTQIPLRWIHGDTYRALRASDLAVTVSGTVTLETALLGTPLIIVYKVPPLEYHAGRFLIRVPFIGLPNLVAGRKVCPELIQQDATPERIAGEIRTLLENPKVRDSRKQALREIAKRVGNPGAARRAARIALNLCDC